jgi:glycine/D-amino acid oxidase-like deaminating enzyme
MAPEYMNREFGVYDKDEGDLRRFLGAQMEQANGRLNVGKVCIFTNTPDEHFIIDKHPEHPHVAIAAGFSGHGYKFSSVVGEILGDLVTEGSTKLDISLFSATRPAIQQQSMEKL